MFCLHRPLGDDARLPYPEKVYITSLAPYLGLAVKAHTPFQSVASLSRLKGPKSSAELVANGFRELVEEEVACEYGWR
jgi:hypothetical protein